MSTAQHKKMFLHKAADASGVVALIVALVAIFKPKKRWLWLIFTVLVIIWGGLYFWPSQETNTPVSTQVGDFNTVVGNVAVPNKMGTGNTIVGATDSRGNTTINTPTVIGYGAKAGPGGIAIGAFAGGGTNPIPTNK